SDSETNRRDATEDERMDMSWSLRARVQGPPERRLCYPVMATRKPERAPEAGVSGTPLPRKLGIAPSTRVLLKNAPDGFLRLLVPLPEGVTFSTRAQGTFP